MLGWRRALKVKGFITGFMLPFTFPVRRRTELDIPDMRDDESDPPGNASHPVRHDHVGVTLDVTFPITDERAITRENFATVILDRCRRAERLTPRFPNDAEITLHDHAVLRDTGKWLTGRVDMSILLDTEDWEDRWGVPAESVGAYLAALLADTPELRRVGTVKWVHSALSRLLPIDLRRLKVARWRYTDPTERDEAFVEETNGGTVHFVRYGSLTAVIWKSPTPSRRGSIELHDHDTPQAALAHLERIKGTGYQPRVSPR